MCIRDSLLGLINDILDLTKIESGAMELENDPFDLRLIVRTAVALVGPRAREKKLEMGVRVPGYLPLFLQGDGHRLRQILINLLGNGVKFTGEGLSLIHI